MILIGILFLLLIVGCVVVIRKFVNSAPNQIPLREDKFKMLGIFLSVIFMGIWIYFGGEFFKSSVGINMLKEESWSFYNDITNLILEINAKGEIYMAAKLMVLRESYIKYIFSFVFAFLSLFILWKITNPPDEDLSLNTKYRRIGIVFSLVFVSSLFLRGIIPTILIILDRF